MPRKRRLVKSEICFGTEKAGLLDFSYNKCALEWIFIKRILHIMKNVIWISIFRNAKKEIDLASVFSDGDLLRTPNLADEIIKGMTIQQTSAFDNRNGWLFTKPLIFVF